MFLSVYIFVFDIPLFRVWLTFNCLLFIAKVTTSLQINLNFSCSITNQCRPHQFRHYHSFHLIFQVVFQTMSIWKMSSSYSSEKLVLIISTDSSKVYVIYHAIIMIYLKRKKLQTMLTTTHLCFHNTVIEDFLPTHYIINMLSLQKITYSMYVFKIQHKCLAYYTYLWKLRFWES